MQKPPWYDESQNSVTFLVMGPEAVTTMGIAEQTGGGASMTFPVTNWGEYHSDWDLSSNIFQLAVEAKTLELLIMFCSLQTSYQP